MFITFFLWIQHVCRPQIDSEEWNKTQGQTVLRTWDVESAHNYENNQDVKMVNSTNVLLLTFPFCSGSPPVSISLIIWISVVVWCNEINIKTNEQTNEQTLLLKSCVSTVRRIALISVAFPAILKVPLKRAQHVNASIRAKDCKGLVTLLYHYTESCNRVAKSVQLVVRNNVTVCCVRLAGPGKLSSKVV